MKFGVSSILIMVVVQSGRVNRVNFRLIGKCKQKRKPALYPGTSGDFCAKGFTGRKAPREGLTRVVLRFLCLSMAPWASQGTRLKKKNHLGTGTKHKQKSPYRCALDNSTETRILLRDAKKNKTII